jgi:hypothetical protein
MTPETSKHELIKMFVDNTLFNFLLKKNVIKKGDTICYGHMLSISVEDLRTYFEQYGYPGLDIPRHQIKKSPQGGEGDSEWTLEKGVYKVWYTERNTPTCVFTTDSKEAFKAYWIKENFYHWEYRLNEVWVF